MSHATPVTSASFNPYAKRANADFDTFAQEVAWGVVAKINKSSEDRFCHRNKDGTVSFFFSKEARNWTWEKCADSSSPDYDFSKYIKHCSYNRLMSQDVQDYFTKCVHYFGYKPIGRAACQLIQDDSSDYIEFRMNLLPRQLDTVLRTSDMYAGYKANGSVLALDGSFHLSPDYIRLFPVRDVGDGHYVLEAKGCQMATMPGLQLLKFSRSYPEQINKGFHWDVDGAPISSHNYMRALEKTLHECGAVPKEERVNFQQTNQYILNLAQLIPGLRLVPIDDDTRDFYARYSNLDAEELSSCKSFEISTKLLLAEFNCELDETIWYENDKLTTTRSAAAPEDEGKELASPDEAVKPAPAFTSDLD